MSFLELFGQDNGSVSTNGPNSGQITFDLFIGDDYLASNARALQWTVAIPNGTTIAESSCTLTFIAASGCEQQTIIFDGTISASDAEATLSFDLPRAETATITAGEYFWIVEWIGDAGEQITKVFNRQLVRWKAKAA